jgi:DeoR family suf operon transcriptional repressor
MLREERQSVSDMARALHITENGVRAQLNALEEEGLVRQAGVFPGTRKPFHAYELTAAGEKLFPKAYGPVLCAMLSALAETRTEAELLELCDETGRRLAKRLAPGHGKVSFEHRVALALKVLSEMGGVASASEGDGKVVISGRNCPLAELVSTEPRTCRLAQSLIGAITGTKVVEKCDKGARPHCCFEIAKA